MLHQPELGKWCGPSALSILSNRSYPEMISLLAFIRDEAYSEISGVYTEELILALHNLGFTATRVDLSRLMRLKTYMATRPSSQKVEPTLITVHRHIIAAHFDYLADNWTKKPIHYNAFPKTGRLVTDVHIIRRRIS